MTPCKRFGLAALAAVIVLPALAAAQQQTPARRRPVRRRQAAIEIRGQVPTPQVVTVRPREVPTYSRQVLVPNFYDHDFWPAILPGYELVPRRALAGAVPADSAPAPAPTGAGRERAASVTGVTTHSDSARTPPGAAPVPRDGTRAPADTVRRAPPATRPPTADSLRRPPGTSSAPTHR